MTPRTRWNAAGLHLIITILVMSSVFSWIAYFWYPPALFSMAGADRLLGILIAIDLVAGPLLTLIIYRQGKPGLRFDLAFIGLAQAAFLAYGLSTIWASRPVFLVAVNDRFNLVFANQIAPDELQLAAKPEWRRLRITGPLLVGAQPPSDAQERNELVFQALAGRDIEQRPQYYVAFVSAAPALLKHARRLDDGRASASLRAALIDKAADIERPIESLRFVPIASSRGFATMLIDASSGLPIAPVGIDPLED